MPTESNHEVIAGFEEAVGAIADSPIGGLYRPSEAHWFEKIPAMRKRRNFSASSYYDRWRESIESLAEAGRMIPNGWAFSTLSGVATYEQYVKTGPISILYTGQSAGLDDIVSQLAENFGRRRVLGGIIFYGHGNMIREVQIVEKLKNCEQLWDRQSSVVLLDCSLPYHLYANSDFNPILRLMKRPKVRAVLVDYEAKANESYIRWLREGLNAMKPALHVFLGNTFCNLEKDVLRTVLERCFPGDFIIAEYVEYDGEKLDKENDDYVCLMAKRAAAELFRLDESKINATNYRNEEFPTFRQETKIELKYNSRPLIMRSMLRRRYQSSETTSEKFDRIGTCTVNQVSVRVDLYIRTG